MPVSLMHWIAPSEKDTDKQAVPGSHLAKAKYNDARPRHAPIPSRCTGDHREVLPTTRPACHAHPMIWIAPTKKDALAETIESHLEN